MSRSHFPPEESEEPEVAPDDGETDAEPPPSGRAVAVLVLRPISAVTPAAPQ